MTRYVVDASVMGPLIFEDEAKLLIASLPETLANGDCIVPAHWQFEVANQILFGAKRGRIMPDEVEPILGALAALPVDIDHASIDFAWSKTHALAVNHQLTIYDAAYLELALRLSLPLATFDKALTRAAIKSDIIIITA